MSQSSVCSSYKYICFRCFCYVNSQLFGIQAKCLSNQEFGTGKKTIEVEVSAEGQAITFVVRTDKEMLGDALLEHGLIAGDPGPYGLYVKRANGMLADYDVNKHYWSFSKNGTGLMTGVDMEPVEDGAHYEITYAK